MRSWMTLSSLVLAACASSGEPPAPEDDRRVAVGDRIEDAYRALDEAPAMLRPELGPIVDGTTLDECYLLPDGTLIALEVQGREVVGLQECAAELPEDERRWTPVESIELDFEGIRHPGLPGQREAGDFVLLDELGKLEVSPPAGTVRCQVVDGQGNPVPHARWIIGGMEGLPRDERIRRLTHTGYVLPVASDEEGRFEVDCPEGGRVSLQIDADGFAPRFVRGISGTMTECEIVVQTGPTVSGRLLRIDRRTPRAGESVTLMCCPDGDDWFHRHTTTAADGSFRFEHVTPSAEGVQWILRTSRATSVVEVGDDGAEVELIEITRE